MRHRSRAGSFRLPGPRPNIKRSQRRRRVSSPRQRLAGARELRLLDPFARRPDLESVLELDPNQPGDHRTPQGRLDLSLRRRCRQRAVQPDRGRRVMFAPTSEKIWWRSMPPPVANSGAPGRCPNPATDSRTTRPAVGSSIGRAKPARRRVWSLPAGIGSTRWIQDGSPGRGVRHRRTGGPSRGGTVAGAVWHRVLVVRATSATSSATTSSPAGCSGASPPCRRGGLWANTWEGHEEYGANCWGGMALDESRGIATSPPARQAQLSRQPPSRRQPLRQLRHRTRRATGKRLWHFQEIRHDIWDLDIPAPPNLVTVMHEGRRSTPSPR